MRLAGWLMLIGGVLLCVSIVWATLGLLMMGVGLVCLLAAEQRRKRAANPAAAGDPPDVEIAATPATPPPLPPPIPSLPRMPGDPPRSLAPLDDATRWRRIVARDKDISRLVATLAPFGQKYVDQLAAAWLADGDKARLPMILDRIVETAAEDARLNQLEAPIQEASMQPDSPVTPVTTGQSLPKPVRKSEIAEPATPPKLPKAEPPDARVTVAKEPQPPAGVETPKPAKAPPAERPARVATITSADDDLAGLLDKFAPDSSFLRKD